MAEHYCCERERARAQEHQAQAQFAMHAATVEEQPFGVLSAWLEAFCAFARQRPSSELRRLSARITLLPDQEFQGLLR